MAVDLTTLSLDVQASIPHVLAAQVGVAVAAASPPAATPLWVQGLPRSPRQLEAAHPPGSGDDLSYHVVCIGREPGLYSSTAEADYQVLGMPNQFRMKKSSRIEALAFYRHKFDLQEVAKWVPNTGAPH
ncbi:hypothetical protein B0H10DRAFT_2202009 [Mycena sp. CBHHK59/15]|nr:hypothetical protein B0H10DRAFT_2202009 [Mycena sp. CBHHK59/15]